LTSNDDLKALITYLEILTVINYYIIVSKSNNNLSAITTIMTFLMLSIALTIIIIHQQQEALAQTDSNISRDERPNYRIQIPVYF
jgi:hypothetical protein